MNRDPSIHITKEEFLNICKELKLPIISKIDDIFRLAQKKAINSRVVVVSNQQITKRINNVLLANKGDASLVASLIYAIRIKLKHKGVRQITPSMPREWVNCKKLAEICNTFCKDFNLETREGFIKYLELGIKRIRSYRQLTQKLISLQETISQTYETEQEYQNLSRKDKEGIKEIHDYYVGKIADKTGIVEDFSKDPEKYGYFIDLYNFLQENGWDYRDYITAQFEGLAWCNSIPELSTLTSDKAVARYNKYLYKYNTSEYPSQDEEEEGSMWDKLNDRDD